MFPNNYQYPSLATQYSTGPNQFSQGLDLSTINGLVQGLIGPLAGQGLANPYTGQINPYQSNNAYGGYQQNAGISSYLGSPGITSTWGNPTWMPQQTPQDAFTGYGCPNPSNSIGWSTSNNYVPYTNYTGNNYQQYCSCGQSNMSNFGSWGQQQSYGSYNQQWGQSFGPSYFPGYQNSGYCPPSVSYGGGAAMSGQQCGCGSPWNTGGYSGQTPNAPWGSTPFGGDPFGNQSPWGQGGPQQTGQHHHHHHHHHHHAGDTPPSTDPCQPPTPPSGSCQPPTPPVATTPTPPPSTTPTVTTPPAKETTTPTTIVPPTVSTLPTTAATPATTTTGDPTQAQTFQPIGEVGQPGVNPASLCAAVNSRLTGSSFAENLKISGNGQIPTSPEATAVWRTLQADPRLRYNTDTQDFFITSQTGQQVNVTSLGSPDILPLTHQTVRQDMGVYFKNIQSLTNSALSDLGSATPSTPNPVQFPPTKQFFG